MSEDPLLGNIAGVVAGSTVLDGSGSDDPRPRAIEKLVANPHYSTCVLHARFVSDHHWNQSPTKKSSSSSSPPPNDDVGVELDRSRAVTRTARSKISLLSGIFEVSFSQPVQDGPVPSDAVFVVFEFLKDDSCIIHVPGYDHDIRVDNWKQQFDLDADQSPASPSNAKIAENSSHLRALHTAKRIRKLILFHVKQTIADKASARNQWRSEYGIDSILTSYEQERLVPPPAVVEKLVATPERAPSMPDEDMGPPDLAAQTEAAKLINLGEIFDAADEESEGILRHGDLLNLLEATLCGPTSTLRPWDIKTIMATIPDDGSGLIDYIRDCDGIPAAVKNCTKRREAYYSRFPDRNVPSDDDVADIPDYLRFSKILEAVEMLEGDEISETARVVMEMCSASDRKNTGYVDRPTLLTALTEKPERITNQERLLLMQLVPEVVVESSDKRVGGPSTGKVRCQYEVFRDTMTHLRTEKVLSPLSETDHKKVYSEIVQSVRIRELGETCGAWVWRELLLELKSLALSMKEIHIILCVLPMDEHGQVDVVSAVRISVTLIDWFFDPEQYHARAHMILEQVEAEKKRRELEELQEMSGVRKSKANEGGEEEEYIDLALRDNREELEKNLVAIMQTLDEDKTGFLPAPLILKQLLSDWERGFPGGGLTWAEKRGFMGQCVIEEEDQVQYSKHIKTWIPILFELRKNANCKRLLEHENVFELGLIDMLDLGMYEREFPVFSSTHARASKGRGGAFGSKRRISADDGARRGSLDTGGSKERRSSKVPRGSVLLAKNSALRASSKAQVPVVEPKELELRPGESRADRRRRLGPDKCAGALGGNGEGHEK